MTQRHSGKRGFTLIELLGVILIIAILIAIALPTFNAVVRSARLTTVRTEMASIESSIASFNSQFGTVPPSYINFVPTNGELPTETRAILRQMFPQIDFAASQPSMQSAGLWDKELKGNEALVFFLGGIRSPGTKELTGFSKNPANPFTPGRTSRIGPFLPFDEGRLREREDGEVPPSRVGNLVYVDRFPGQTTPMLYASTGGTNTLIESHVRATPRVANPTNLSEFYRDGFLPIKPDGTLDTDPTPPERSYGLYKKESGSPWSNNEYVLVSPGADGEYGRGNPYDPNPNKARAWWGENTKELLNQHDADNLTNFSEGVLSN